MQRIIPRDLIRHLEWNPEKQPLTPKRPKSKTPPKIKSINFDIESLVNSGKVFYNANLPEAFKSAFEYATSKGVVASMPYLIAGKENAVKKNYLWQEWFTALSEEDVGIDKKGKFVSAGSPVILTVHGGGILTPERIQHAYDEGLTPQSAAKLSVEEFDNLLEGNLPNGEKIEVYSIEDLEKGIKNPFGRYAVALDFETARSVESGYLNKKDFMTNKLVLARVGTLEHLSKYFNKAKDPNDNSLGNHHRLNEIDCNQSQGRLLFLNFVFNGLYGDIDLNNYGCFVGVAPEAPDAPTSRRKK